METDIVGVLIGIIGIVLSIYFYRKSLRKKEPCWRVRSNNFIEEFSEKVEGLNVSYNNKLVKNLTVSKILFWNNGKETIYRKDIQILNKLRIKAAEGVNILDAKVLKSNNSSNQFAVTIDRNEESAYIEFEYLDENQGAIIQIIHTGKQSEDLIVVGDMIGAKSIKNMSIPPKWIKWIRTASNTKLIQKFNDIKFLGLILIMGSLFMLLFGLLNLLISLGIFDSKSYYDLSVSTGSLVINFIFSTLIGLVALSIGIYSLIPLKPKGFDIYFED